jgi:hypothetical protein
MKKIVIILVIVAGLYFGNKLLNDYLFKQYEKSSFIRLTGINNFQVISRVHDNHHCYVKALVSPKDKQLLLNKHYYESFPLNLRGNVQCDYEFSKGESFQYYLEDKGHGFLAYVLYLVSKNDNTVILYQNFGD